MPTSPPKTLSRHTPVMLAEVLAALKPASGGIYVDGTFGAGGYTEAILEAADCRVYAIDRDPTAIEGGAALKARYADRLTLIEGRFSDMAEVLAELDIHAVDGIVLDLGVSSMQLDRPERGFSFQTDGPLDMRMGAHGRTAADLVNELPEAELHRIIAVYGEEKRARAIARAIARERKVRPITRTCELASLVEGVIGRMPGGEKLHPATRTFQALRIEVNDELDEIANTLAVAEILLAPGGRLVVVSFHSLEDRIVKRFLAERMPGRALPSRHQPSLESAPATFVALARGAGQPTQAEIAANPRARSARLRAATRTDAPVQNRAAR
ncbi:MAG: 16S rRNA (cytosine(1402)-N(4))-methyltransferase RsmH [Parvibaculaceae bacterium]